MAIALSAVVAFAKLKPPYLRKGVECGLSVYISPYIDFSAILFSEKHLELKELGLEYNHIALSKNMTSQRSLSSK